MLTKRELARVMEKKEKILQECEESVSVPMDWNIRIKINDKWKQARFELNILREVLEI
jgi:hypothetical protein